MLNSIGKFTARKKKTSDRTHRKILFMAWTKNFTLRFRKHVAYMKMHMFNHEWKYFSDIFQPKRKENKDLSI
jgi:hypothetical protein